MFIHERKVDGHEKGEGGALKDNHRTTRNKDYEILFPRFDAGVFGGTLPFAGEDPFGCAQACPRHTYTLGPPSFF